MPAIASQSSHSNCYLMQVQIFDFRPLSIDLLIFRIEKLFTNSKVLVVIIGSRCVWKKKRKNGKLRRKFIPGQYANYALQYDQFRPSTSPPPSEHSLQVTCESTNVLFLLILDSRKSRNYDSTGERSVSHFVGTDTVNIP